MEDKENIIQANQIDPIILLCKSLRQLVDIANKVIKLPEHVEKISSKNGNIYVEVQKYCFDKTIEVTFQKYDPNLGGLFVDLTSHNPAFDIIIKNKLVELIKQDYIKVSKLTLIIDVNKALKEFGQNIRIKEFYKLDGYYKIIFLMEFRTVDNNNVVVTDIDIEFRLDY